MNQFNNISSIMGATPRLTPIDNEADLRYAIAAAPDGVPNDLGLPSIITLTGGTLLIPANKIVTIGKPYALIEHVRFDKGVAKQLVTLLS